MIKTNALFVSGDGLIVARVLSTKPLPEAEKIYHKLGP